MVWKRRARPRGFIRSRLSISRSSEPIFITTLTKDFKTLAIFSVITILLFDDGKLSDNNVHNTRRDLPEKHATNKMLTLQEDGLYDILSRIELLDEELPEATATLECTLRIPKANYSVSRMTVYNSG